VTAALPLPRAAGEGRPTPPAGEGRPTPSPGGDDRPAPGRRRRRWHRVAVPFAVLALLYLVTGVAHAVEEPDLDDPSTLSPTGAGPDGSDRLAALLAAEGVTIRRVTSSAEALQVLAAGGQRSTVFVPAPGLIDPTFVWRVPGASGGGHRVVLARPGLRPALAAGFLPVHSRWAARPVPPRCTTDFAVAAGPAAVLRSRYVADPDEVLFRCYEGGLVGIKRGTTEYLAVGATDPFRNSRIGEVGNAPLATALLGRDRQLVWIDVHRAERRPRAPAGGDWPGYRQPERVGGGSHPLWDALPPVLWVSLTLLGALGALAALVRARRLGPPVAEPLPVVVPATETVTGRGRLYERIRSRPETLDALRSAALRRITPLIRPTTAVGGAAAPERDEVVASVTHRTRLPAREVAEILYGRPPQTDEELAQAVARLDALVAALRQTPVPTQPPDPSTLEEHRD
jgi:hypothetical protein